MDQNRRALALQSVVAAAAIGGVRTAPAAEPRKGKVPQVIKEWMEPWTAGGLSNAGAR